MFFKSFFDKNLAQMSYMVGCQKTGEALVVDPARDITPYVKTADEEGFSITGAVETHIHADFTSGVRELESRHGAKMYLSDEGNEGWKYANLDQVNHELLMDGDQFYVGKVRLDVMHTPGHTPESLSFVLTDEGGGAEAPMGIFTGDFVFVGDVGRPDLLEKAANEKGSARRGAEEMYASVQKFKELPEYMQVWPGHGAGSACGKSLGAVPASTVGYEKRTNWALNINDKEKFVDALLEGQPESPKYFSQMKKLNKQGPELVTTAPLPQLSYEDLQRRDKQNIIDTRPSSDFANGHLKGTINIPFNKSFTNWAGWLLDYENSIVLIANEEEAEAVRTALQSIGLDQVTGFMSPGELKEAEELETYDSITAKELKEKYKDHEDYVIVDVRNESEWKEGHINNAQHIMLGTLEDRTEEIPDGATPIVHCQSGMRSAIAASLLQAKGYKNVLNLKGGYSSWEKQS
ncbi:MBL fold metallo-hydrolase [Halobacillus salinarum]|uniref:MBL fold metallo-hydrolase n=1 Tax=Halobacillus salinarum TaxID=2932257 RepID=A0ABY4EMG1_9BACI|nr:MBL fold metallo-hydrolase [Halobacillus salinarum]UOQ45185.1 MBL fold metallo-hydrolase [Halobacillus salinarum]